MAQAHPLDFPRSGGERELKKALAAHWCGELRAPYWQARHDAGIELLPVGDFAWYDQVLGQALAVGVTLTWCRPVQLFEVVEQAQALGHRVKPVLIGPLTYLWLAKAEGAADVDTLDLLEGLLPVYGEILERLAAQGVEWVQLDEPILCLDLPLAWRNAFERAYNLLQWSPLKKLLATYFGGLGDNLGLAAGLPVQGLHIDPERAPEQWPQLLDRLPSYKVLSLDLASGRTDWGDDLLCQAQARFGDNLWVSGARQAAGLRA